MTRVVEAIVHRYRRSAAGRTGVARRDLLLRFNELFKEAGCLHGPERHEAIGELERLERAGYLRLHRHRSDPAEILQIRLPLAQAEPLLCHLGLSAPGDERAQVEALFCTAGQQAVPEEYREGWRQFCITMAASARAGETLKPLDRNQPGQIEAILHALPKILDRKSESLMRFASSQLFGDSKTLELLRPKIEASLQQITGKSGDLAEFGIEENPRSFLLHGPATLRLEGGELAIGLLREPIRIGAGDLQRAEITPHTSRCLTVENAAMLYELAKLDSGTLLASSGSDGGFANSAVIRFLQILPESIELWHFGDTDPKGFDILRDLRERSGRTIHSLKMTHRSDGDLGKALSPDDLRTIPRLLASPLLTCEEKATLKEMQVTGLKGRFEQESLGYPLAAWPFY